MSHFTRLKTKLADGDLVAKALTELGIKFSRGRQTINGYRGGRTTAEFRIPTSNASYDIGLELKSGAYEMVADWYGISNFNQNELVARLNRAYSILATKQSLESQGFNLISEHQEKNGEVRLLLRRMA
ncbi:MAG: DUF1257 domain-containing protein [Planctomycetes bacterium]|nr:DUF1257 domain-containing protein [Planctomycetota bacterium]